MLTQDFASGQVCWVNQDHYESRYRRVVMRLAYATDRRDLIAVLYQQYNSIVYYNSMTQDVIEIVDMHTRGKQIGQN